MLITPYAAAQQAGVHKQTIYDQIDRKPTTAYFVKDAQDQVMVDDENPLWKSYVDKIRLKKKKGIMQGKSKPLDPEAQYKKMGAAVTMILNRELDLPRERLVEILGMIDKEYGGKNG